MRRFQGIFDGPNPAAYFILLYLGILCTYFRDDRKYTYLLSLWAIVLLGLLFYTYSRSSLIGLSVGLLGFFFLHIGTVFRKYKKALLAVIPIFLIVGGLFFLKFEGTMDRILFREGSTKGHFDRAVIGLDRAMKKPFGSGLATSGPSYRYVLHPEADESLFE